MENCILKTRRKRKENKEGKNLLASLFYFIVVQEVIYILYSLLKNQWPLLPVLTRYIIYAIYITSNNDVNCFLTCVTRLLLASCSLNSLHIRIGCNENNMKFLNFISLLYQSPNFLYDIIFSKCYNERKRNIWFCYHLYIVHTFFPYFFFSCSIS